jgi:hypothetical protein
MPYFFGTSSQWRHQPVVDGSRSMRDEFSVLLSRNDNALGGVIRSLSTFVVLIGLTFGQSVLVTLGLFVLWLAGEIGGGGLE